MTLNLDPHLYDVTITNPDGSTETEQWRQSRASHHVRRQVHLISAGETRLQVDPATDATGALRVVQTIPARSGADLVKTWDLVPLVRPKLTEAQFDDLAALAESTWKAGGGTYRGGTVHLVQRGGVQRASVSLSGYDALSPARFELLIRKGWASMVTPDLVEGAPVTVSLAGRVALALAAHQTRTSSPNGYIKPADHPNPEIANSGAVGPWRKGGRIFDGISYAVCSCGELKGKACERRYLAQSVTRAHRAEKVMEWLGANAEQARAAASRAGVIGPSRPFARAS